MIDMNKAGFNPACTNHKGQDDTEREKPDLISAIENITIKNKMKYQSLFEHINTGFAYFSIDKDKQGVPCDFVLLEYNSAFKRDYQITKRNVIGEKASQLFGSEEDWNRIILENLKKAAMTRDSLHFELFIKKLHRYINISIYCADNEHMELLSRDITEYKDIMELKQINMYFSTRFNHIPIEKLNDEINNALYEIGQLYDVECSYIFRINESNNIFELSNSWIMNGIKIPDKFEKISPEDFHWLMKQIDKYQVFKITSLNEIPDEAAREREYFEELGCKSIVFLPIKYEEKQLGIMGLITFNHEKIWTADQIDLLKIICTIFARAFERKIMDNTLQNELDKLEKMEKVLMDSEEKYESLANSLQDAIITLDDEGSIVGWNKAAESIFGYKYQEVIGRKLHEFLIPQEIRKRAEENFKIFKADGTGRLINKVTEVHALRKDGSELIAEISTSVINLTGKRHIVGIVRDITERRQTQKKLLDAMDAAQAANRAKSQFLANISHEIRTPMNGIIGFLDILSKTPLNSQQLDYLREIKTSSEALLGLINDLLDFSKIEANKMELENTEFNIRGLIEDEVSSFSLRAYTKGIELHAKIDDSIPDMMKGDQGKLKQVLENLIGNAVKFTNKGKVVVTAESVYIDKDRINILFSIEDTGIGIEESEIGKLFEPFTQVDASTTRKFGGTGLGLSICEKLVEMMSGNITVESELGKGSTFSFAISFERVHSNIDPVVIEDLKGLRVLVADFSSTNRKIVRYYLEGAGCIVYEAENAKESLEILKDAAQNGSPIKVVLLDNELPDRRGLDLAAEIKADQILKSAAINLFTSYADTCGQKAEGREEISGLINKPVFRNELINSILTVLGKSDRILGQTVNKLDNEVVFDDQIKKNTKILLVEDNVTNQKLVATILCNAGISYDIAQNGKEAVEAADKNPYSLVFMDCQMPELDGYEAAKLIRQKEAGKSHLAIIAMTANVMKSDIDRCLNSGMDDYISKPFKANELLEIAAKWLKKGFPVAEKAIEGKAAILFEEKGSDEEAADIPGILNQLSENQKISRNDIYEIYNDFVDMLPDSILKLQNAIDSADFKKITLDAHTIKGASATLRLSSLSKIAAELEKQGKAEDISLCRANMERLSEYCGKYIKNISL